MAKRTRKPPVKPEKRLEWFNRVEKEGETLTHIAEVDEFDIRTVSKHVELARQERDIRSARTEVLRDALVAHYRDLIETAKDIQKQVSSLSPLTSEKDTPLMAGLRMHMPRSPLWENIKRWNQAVIEFSEEGTLIRNRLQKDIEADGRLNGIISYDGNDVIRAAFDVLNHQIEQWVRQSEGLNLDYDIHIEKRAGGRVSMRYGFSPFGEIGESNVDVIKAVLADFQKKIKDWLEFQQMENLYNRLGVLQRRIGEILTIIFLRRIVPGRCKYCPL
jgi:hypothetical protein